MTGTFNDRTNISSENKSINSAYVINIISMNGKVIDTKKVTGNLIRLDVPRIQIGLCTVKSTRGGKSVTKVIPIVK